MIDHSEVEQIVEASQDADEMKRNEEERSEKTDLEQ